MSIEIITNPGTSKDRADILKLWQAWYGNERDLETMTKDVDLICDLSPKHWLPHLIAAKHEELGIIATGAVISTPLISGASLYPIVTSVYVDPGFRKQSIGSSIIKELARYIFNQQYPESPKVSEMYLCTDVCGFYEKLNFVQLHDGFAHDTLRAKQPDEPYVYQLTEDAFRALKKGESL